MDVPEFIPDPPETIDSELLGRLLLNVETHQHRLGWDQPAAGLTVFLLIDFTDQEVADLVRRVMSRNPKFGPPARAGRYAAQRILTPELFAQSHHQPYESLRIFALNIAFADEPEPAQMRLMLRLPGVLGFAACYEAWQAPPDADPRDLLTSDTRIADMPGATEIRVVSAVDAAEQTHLVHRVRGRKAVLTDAVSMGGEMSTSLKILTDTAFVRVPPLEQADARYLGILDSYDMEVLRRDSSVTPEDVLRPTRDSAEG